MSNVLEGMRARYTITKPAKELFKLYQVAIPDTFQPNFNLTPTQEGLVITADEPGWLRKCILA
jgi:putative SOS response-associated peptidase YedK